MHLGETVCPDEQRVDMPSDCQFECAAEVVLAAHVKSSAWRPRARAAVFVSSHSGGSSRIAHIVKQRHSRETRNQLFEEFNPFPGQLGAEGRHPGNIAPRVREARHDGMRVAHRRHHHGNGSGRVLGRPGGWRPPGHDQVDLETNQFGREVREPLGATIRRPIFDDQVSPFDVAEVPQPLAQGVEIGGVPCRGYRLQNPDAIDLPRLLRCSGRGGDKS